MQYSPYLRNAFFSFCFLAIFSCGSDKNSPFGLQENEITYFLGTGAERLYPASCTLEKQGKRYKLSLKGSDESDGLIMTIKNIKSLGKQTLRFNKEVNVIVNEKEEKGLNIYVSSGCKENQGQLEIVDWDTNNNTITGLFSGPVCTRGIFAHLPSTEIKEGAFYKLKYNVK